MVWLKALQSAVAMSECNQHFRTALYRVNDRQLTWPARLRGTAVAERGIRGKISPLDRRRGGERGKGEDQGKSEGVLHGGTLGEYREGVSQGRSEMKSKEKPTRDVHLYIFTTLPDLHIKSHANS